MQAQPLVSIIIPVYNGANYLRECIDSALSQTYPNIEILVVNDGSKDGGATEAVALSYGDRIRYFAKENGGVSSALNLGIREMRGDFFSWLSHADRYAPDKVARQMERIMEHSDTTVMAVCRTGQINSRSERIREGVALPLPPDVVLPPEQALMEFIHLGGLNGCALLIPRSKLLACGGFAEDLRYCQDYLMWMKIFMQDCALLYVPFEDVQMRVHEEQFTNRGRDLYAKESYTVCERILPYLLEHSTKRHNYLYEFAKSTGIHNNYSSVQLCLKEGKPRGILTGGQRMKLRVIMLYGRIRPILRKVYYRIFRRVKV